MKETTNYGFKKPEANDFYDFETQNDNLDEIDRVLQEITDGTQQVGDSAKLGGKALNDIVLQGSKSVYVSPNGSDETGDGTQENPWKTIQKAVNECPIGATSTAMYSVYLANGVYEEDVDIRRKTIRFWATEAANADITIKGTLSAMYDANVENRAPITIDLSETTKINCLTVSNFARFFQYAPLIVNVNSTQKGIYVNVSSSFTSGGSAITINGAETAFACAYNSYSHPINIVINDCTKGLYAENGGKLSYASIKMTNVTTEFTTLYGGRIYTGAQTSVGQY